MIVGAAVLRSATAAFACAVYAVTIVGLFAVSAFYHRVSWKSPRAHVRMKRADHSMIFVFIAGTYTLFCLLALPSPVNWWVLGGIVGRRHRRVTLKIAWPVRRAGWCVAVHPARLGDRRRLPALVDHTSVAVMVLLAAGGILYSVGGILYAAKWPNPGRRVSVTTRCSTPAPPSPPPCTTSPSGWSSPPVEYHGKADHPRRS